MRTIVYRDLFGGWRWECENAEGDIVDSPYSYDTREDCIEGAAAAGLDVSPLRHCTLAQSISYRQQLSRNGQ